MHIATRVPLDSLPDLTPEQLKASIVQNIAERLEVFRARAVTDRSVKLTMEYATEIVNAVFALSKGRM